MRPRALVALALCIPAALRADGDGGSAMHASVLDLALRCDSYDQRRVVVVGAVSLGFEDHSLCPTRDFLDADPLNCLWIATDPSFPVEQFTRLSEEVASGTYLMIEGTLSCAHRGHLSLWGAALTEITLVVDNTTGRVLWRANDQ